MSKNKFATLSGISVHRENLNGHRYMATGKWLKKQSTKRTHRFRIFLRDKKSMGMAMFKRTFARTIPDNSRAPHMKMWGFEAKRARKFTRTSPRTLPWNFITMLSAPVIFPCFRSHFLGRPFLMGSQYPSPNVKMFCKFEPQIWLEIITSRDAEIACFKGSRTSCREIIFGIFWPNFGRKRSHHVMDASCRSDRFWPSFFALFWPSVFALFHTIRLPPVSGCHFDSPVVQFVLAF